MGLGVGPRHDPKWLAPFGPQEPWPGSMCLGRNRATSSSVAWNGSNGGPTPSAREVEGGSGRVCVVTEQREMERHWTTEYHAAPALTGSSHQSPAPLPPSSRWKREQSKREAPRRDFIPNRFKVTQAFHEIATQSSCSKRGLKMMMWHGHMKI